MGAAVTAEPKSKKSKSDLSAEAAPVPESSFQLEAMYGATAGMPLFLDVPLQRKLAVGAVDDPLEREADQVAQQVMRMPEPGAAATPSPHPNLSFDQPRLEVGLGATGIQRKCACGGSSSGECEECQQKREEERPGTPAIQRRANRNGHGKGDGSAGPTEAPPIVHQVLRSTGQPLDASVRPLMESRFGRDFGDVRVHTDSLAAKSAQAVNALAFTAGKDVAFAPGQFSPHSTEGQRLLVHELTHVVQQGKDTSVSAAPAQVQRQPATADPNADVSKAEDFLLNYPAELAAELRLDTALQRFTLGSPYLTWEADGESRFKQQVAEELFPSGGSLRSNLARALAPISEFQILQTICRTLIDDRSENAVPRVAYELMPLVKRQIDASLRRIVPRYLAARNQTVLSSSDRSQPSLEPPLDQIPTSAPADSAVVAGLTSGVATLDELGYRKAFPQEAQPRTSLGIKSPGDIEFLSSQGSPQWVRAGNKDATAEDVAAVLYGTSNLAYKIVAAAPLFGFDPGSLIEEPYGRLWRESLEKAGLGQLAASAKEGFYPVASPLNSIPGSAVQDEVILGQAKALAPTGATQIEVVQQMRLALGIADQMIAGAGKFGLSNVLAGMRSRLDARSRKFAAKEASAEAEAWGAQVAEQYDILNGAAAGLATAAAELSSYTGGEIPRFIQDPLHNLASAYAEAGSLSEFADAGQQSWPPRTSFRILRHRCLDGALRYIHDSLKAITPDAAEKMGGDTSALVSQEKGLRSELADIRSLVKEDPKRVVELVQALQKKVNKLSSRVGVLSTLGAIDSLTEALKTHVSNIYSTPSGSIMTGIPRAGEDDWKRDTVKPYDQAIASLAEFRSIWAGIAKTAFSGTDEELEQQIKATAGKQKELAES